MTENEEIFYIALYADSKMYDIIAIPKHDLTKWLEEMDKNISNMPRYKQIMSVAKMMFYTGDQVGKDTLKSFDKVVRSISCIDARADLSPEQYKRMVRFQEDSMKRQKNNILCQIENPEFKLDEETLKELLDIKDAINKKRKYGLV